jgi:hypothetical protein
MAFRGLLYTDCRADESLRGGTGYQFQAATADAKTADEAVMLQELMYKPSPDLMAREAPLDQYPPSFAYFRTDEGYSLATGIYLGRVSGDGRQGNQITHAVFTDDVDDLAGSRPAQFFGADFWVRTKQPYKQLDTIEPPLLYADEFDLPALHELACAAPDSKGFVAKLLSTFERAAADTGWVKTILSCSDPRTALQWIALGTMMLPTDQALSLSIRAFLNQPASATQRIVAIHPPSMDRAPDVTTIPAVAGIDLDRFATSTIEVTERASYWADRFIDGDPYDVIDAIELAGRLRGSSDANRVVAAALVLGEPLRGAAGVDAAGEVVHTFDVDEYEEYAGQLVEAMERVEGDDDLRPGAFLQVLPVVRRFHGATSELLDRLQANLLHRAALSPDFARLLIIDTSWSWQWHTPPPPGSQPARALTAVLGAQPADVLPGAFGFAARIGVPTDPTTLAGPRGRLADYWLHNPQLTADHRRWLHADRVLDLLLQGLDHQLRTGPDRDIETAIQAGQWDWLLNIDWVVRGGGPLPAEIAGRSIPKADPQRQEHLVRLIATTVGPGGWQPLWRNRIPGLNEVMLWLDCHPRDVEDVRFVEPAGRSLSQAVDSGRISGRDLRLIEDLHRVAPDRLPRNVARVGRQNVDLTRTLQVLRSRRPENGAAMALASLDPIVLEIRMKEIARVLANDAEVDAVAEFLRTAKVDGSDQLIAALQESAQHYPIEAVELAFLLARTQLPKPTLKKVSAFPLQWYESADDGDRARTGKQLQPQYPEWDDLLTRYERKNESAFKKVGRMFGARETER